MSELVLKAAKALLTERGTVSVSDVYYRLLMNRIKLPRHEVEAALEQLANSGRLRHEPRYGCPCAGRRYS